MADLKCAQMTDNEITARQLLSNKVSIKSKVLSVLCTHVDGHS